MQLGNPLLEFNTDFNSRMEYLWSHGLISDTTYELSQKVCNFSQIRRQAQQGFLSAPCRLVSSHMSSEIGKFIDSYDVTLDVCYHSVSQQAHILNQMAVKDNFILCYRLVRYHCIFLYVFLWLTTNLITGWREDWCLSRWWNNQILEQKRCTKGYECTTYWGHSLDYL